MAPGVPRRRRADLRHPLRAELRYILDPADIYGADYSSETFRVLKDNESRQCGECRTRRLILEAWARLET